MNDFQAQLQRERIFERYSTLCDNDFTLYNKDIIKYLAHDEELTFDEVLLIIEKERKKIHEHKRN